MIRPTIVLFDLGKVLVDFDWQDALQRIAADARATPDEIACFIASTDVMRRYEHGHITSDRFFEEVQQGIGYRSDSETFRLAFSDIFSEITDMVALHSRLRAAGIRSWIFSNTNDWAVTQIRARFPFFAHFDGYFLSYELGAMKPHPAIYEAAERSTGCRGGEILYIDDLHENVVAGAQRGWQVIHHVSTDATIAEVEARLLDPFAA